MPSNGSGFYFYDLLDSGDIVIAWCVYVSARNALFSVMCATILGKFFHLYPQHLLKCPSAWFKQKDEDFCGFANYNISMTHNFPLLGWIESGSHVAEHTDTGSRGDAVRSHFF